MAKPRVLVTRRWPAAVEARLSQIFDVQLNLADKPLAPDDFLAAMREYDAILPTVTDRIGAPALELHRPQTRILANYGVGYSHIDLNRVSRHGIVVTNTPDVLSECTADLAMTLLLMVARRAGEGERELRAGQWTGWRPTHLVGTKVSGKTLGIVGYGRIGQEMARRAHHGFGMTILVYNRSPVAPEVLAQCNAVQVDSLDELMPRCDFISLHCPGGASNRHLINAHRLNLMRPDAFLINTARGEVIDETALSHALWFDSIGGAALDVFDGEPNINPQLRDSDRLVMLPHLGSATREAREAMGFRVIQNLEDFFAGREPRDRVN
ncbi:2-hydroxyacid dehydrogenase [Paracoccus siganidrum]|uniref:D-glycerate dehydrogenase n=1 Tax=Paracoccus siganidrum TaxID=1276757 RepID=A0A419A9N0_9RHOB|nr:D-glycerate dehydrogenase [Paracoccus siganidrum]RJL19421.1 D-glycerate dehydrogenase [Paracoccus siganidrum]RMC29634.1 D-glycerate dehydrogenase [Paracoccus siganidrum]